MTSTVAATNGVHAGEKGHLFLTAGGHAAFDYALGNRKVTEASLATFANNMAGRRRLADGLGIPFRHMIVPDKQSVLSDLVIGARISVRLGEEYRARVDPGDVLYPLDSLRALGPDSFMRTDTHLTGRANILLARQLFHALTGEITGEERDGLEAALVIRKHVVGDLGSKLVPSQGADELFLRKAWGKTYSNNLTANDGLIDLHLNPQALRLSRLLIFGDSFARGLGPALSRLFSEVLFLRSRYVHAEMLWLARPDYLLSQNVERYLASVSPDAAAPPFFLYPDLPKRGGDGGERGELAAMLAGLLRNPAEL